MAGLHFRATNTQTKTKFQTKQPSFGSSSQLSVGHVCPQQPISGVTVVTRLSTECVGGFIPPKTLMEKSSTIVGGFSPTHWKNMRKYKMGENLPHL